MTREEILAMQPGKELDSLIELKIFEKTMSMVGLNEHIGHYSTDISAAWDVLEKFETFQVTKMFPCDDSNNYKAIVKANHHRVYAETAPEAICKAALLAVMEVTE